MSPDTVKETIEVNGQKWVFNEDGSLDLAGSLSVQDGDIAVDWYTETVGGEVSDGDAAPVWVTTLKNGETLNVTQAGLVLDDSSAAPAGLDLIIANLTNMTSETTLINGDGTVKDDQIGSPLGSYQNQSGGEEQVGVLIDNGNFNSGAGSPQKAIGTFIGRVV